jgi:16S rRNA (guanine527-N7)-methyltransferase
MAFLVPQDGLKDVSRETLEQLSCFVSLVKKWNKSINLVSPSTIDDIWNRHILDCAQLFEFRKSDADHWVDLGSGGGLPGLVLAIMAQGLGGQMKFSLVESDRRKSVFLAVTAKQMNLNVTVHCERIENLAPLGADVVSARAVAGLDTLCSWATRHLAPSGCAVFAKGARSAEEVVMARKNWTFDITEKPSYTEKEAKILILENIRHV